MKRFGEAFAISSLLSLCIASYAHAKDAASTRPTTAQVSRDRKSEIAANTAVSAAIRELAREYSAHQIDSKKPLRGVCNYFNDHPSSEITTEAILAALERGAAAPDPHCDGYIRWQLLSGAPAKFDEALLSRLLRIYKSAPEPEPAPGITQEERSKLELGRRSARQEDIEKLNQQLNDLQLSRREANEPILAYRDELFARLPLTYDAVAAGMQDAFVRLKAGAETQSIVEPVIKATHAWMASAPAQQLSQLAHVAGTLSKEKGPELYEAAWWSERSYKVMWRKHTLDLNKTDQLGKLQRDLLEQARNPGAGLKFKDESSSGSSKRSSKTSTAKDRS